MSIYENKLKSQLAGLVENLLKKGFRPPIYAVCVDANGNLIATHYREADEGGVEAVFVAEYLPDDNMTVPVKLFFVDSATGRTAAFTIENDVVTGNSIN